MPFDVKAAQKFFFDRAAVSDAIDAGARRALSKFGAFTRRTARSSIRKRKKASKPGAPPSSHTGVLKRFLFFGYDPAAKSVVIGPVLAGNKTGAPETLEYSGPVTIREAVSDPIRRAKSAAQARAYKKLVREGRVTAKPRQYRTKTIFVEARPYMDPAFKAELPKAPQLFKDAIK